MRAWGLPKSFVLSWGPIASLPLQDCSFDFSASNGVLMHLEDAGCARVAVSEMVRVTRMVRVCYAYTGIDGPGLVDTYIVPAIRRAYSENAEFRVYIDTLTEPALQEEVTEVFRTGEPFDPSLRGVSALVTELLTLDSGTFLQNLMQVPVQQGPLLGERWAPEAFEEGGCTDVRRLADVYWRRHDFRRFLVPFHHSKVGRLATLLYGGGHLKVRARRV